tara:strand:- start:10657 stop:11097 length:441 start_codon:yes stop_codon:yes gene_type:complete
VSFCLLTANAGDKGRKRLEELFIWKVSDILELTSEQDSEFRSIIEDLNQKKLQANIDMRASIRAIEKAEKKEVQIKLIEAYKKQLNAYLAVQKEELDRLEDLFGSEKLAKYLVVKSKLTQNLKVLMGNNGETKVKKLAKPEVELEN